MVIDEHRRVISIGFVKNDKTGFTLEFEDESGHQYSLPLDYCEKLVEIDRRMVSAMVLITTEYILKDGRITGVKPVIQYVIGQTFD